MKAMILAAGRGERLRPLTDSIPKPLVEVAGKPLIVYHIENLVQAGVSDIVINHAWLGDKLVESLGDGKRWGVNIHYSAEDAALETAGGIKQALPLLGDSPFLVLNGDIYIDNLPFESVSELEDKLKESIAHLWLVANPTHNPRGDFSFMDGRVMTSFCDDQTFTFSGIALYRPEFFAKVESGQKKRLAPLLRAQVDKKQITGELYPDYWCDVGTVTRLELLNKKLADK